MATHIDYSTGNSYGVSGANNASTAYVAPSVLKTGSGLSYLANNADSYINALNTEQAWLREDMLRKEGYEREDKAYDRLFEQLKRNGINPALLLSSVSPTVGQANTNSVSAFKNSNYDTNAKTDQANSAKVVGAILAALAMIAAAAL